MPPRMHDRASYDPPLNIDWGSAVQDEKAKSEKKSRIQYETMFRVCCLIS